MTIIRKEDKDKLKASEAKPEPCLQTDLPLSERDEMEQAEARTQRLQKQATEQKEDNDKKDENH